MKSSFIDRVFPNPTSSPILPQYQRKQELRRRASPSTPSPLHSGTSSRPLRSQHDSTLGSQMLSPTPLSASIIHHADPLLPVDRAAKALQKTIQSMLNAQSDGLLAGLGAGSPDDVSSVGSLTPTPSVSTSPRGSTGLKTTPVRQPVPKKVSLRGSRKGLARSMQDFALLKEQELRILESQSQSRSAALQKIEDLETKRAGLKEQVDAIKSEGTSSTAQQLQKEALELDGEIKELENKLFELKARKRHRLAQASDIENSVSSKLSSYTSSLALVDQDIKEFLRRPPISSILSTRNSAKSESMYDLKAERRTLEMAKEQWTAEQIFLDARKVEAATEKRALEKGSASWRECVECINAFEKELRAATRDMSQSQSTSRSPPATNPPDHSANMLSLFPSLDSAITFLETKFNDAEMNNWNLLICCIGAELEALEQGRALLRQTLGLSALGLSDSSKDETVGSDSNLEQYSGDQKDKPPHSPGVESNKSLEDTLKAFGGPQPGPVEEKGKSVLRNGLVEVTPETGAGLSGGFGPTRGDSESEEDDPGLFFLSH